MWRSNLHCHHLGRLTRNALHSRPLRSFKPLLLDRSCGYPAWQAAPQATATMMCWAGSARCTDSLAPSEFALANGLQESAPTGCAICIGIGYEYPQRLILSSRNGCSIRRFPARQLDCRNLSLATSCSQPCFFAKLCIEQTR